MKNAIKYILCAGASLAIGFGAGYFFKQGQDNITAPSRIAQFGADSTHYSSESFKQISSSLYSAEKSAQEIHNSLEDIKKGLNDMGRGYTGGPGLPGKTGIGDLFPGPGTGGSSKVGGLDDLFKDEKEENNDQEENKEEEKKNYEKSSGPFNDLKQIEGHILAGRKALAIGKAVADSITGNVPSVPEIPRLYEEGKKQE